MYSKHDQDLSLNDTAEFLDVPRQAVLRWARNGALPSRNFHGETHFRRADVEAWALRMGMKLRKGSTGAREGAPNALAASLRRGGLITSLPGKTVSEVLQELVARIEPPPELEREKLLELLLARERLASTAVGDGVALPHPRQPLVNHLREPRVVVARLENGIDWHSLDQQPVQLLMLVLSCSLKGHLDMLSRIALALKAPELRQALETATGLDHLFQTVQEYPE